VDQFELSPLKRLFSRLYFYAAVCSTFWIVGQLIPTSSEAHATKDQELGVAKAYIAVPVENVPIAKSPTPVK